MAFAEAPIAAGMPDKSDELLGERGNLLVQAILAAAAGRRLLDDYLALQHHLEKPFKVPDVVCIVRVVLALKAIEATVLRIAPEIALSLPVIVREAAARCVKVLQPAKLVMDR